VHWGGYYATSLDIEGWLHSRGAGGAMLLTKVFLKPKVVEPKASRWVVITRL
jgi:hypothetical protein